VHCSFWPRLLRRRASLARPICRLRRRPLSDHRSRGRSGKESISAQTLVARGPIRRGVTDVSEGGLATCSTAPADVVTQSPKGWIGGGQFGDRWQWGNLVAGLEATLEGVGVSATTVDPVFPSTTRTTKFTGLYTFTGQAGWAFDRLLVYGKGGWASTRLSFQANAGVDGPNLTASDFTDGWTAGVGVEYQVIPRLIVGVEYDYYRFDPKDLMSVTNTAGVTIPCGFCNFGSSTTMQTVLARISIQAGPIPGLGY
jgi:opacity protein-like surface antigen